MLLVAAGVVAPVLLLADGEIVLGVVALLVGAALVAVLSRSLESLSRRWAVLVPAGFVVVDPLTLADPVLFLREHVRERRARTRRRGTERRSSTSASAPVRARCRPGSTRRSTWSGPPAGDAAARRSRPTRSCVAVARRDEMLRLAAARRLPVRVTVR